MDGLGRSQERAKNAHQGYLNTRQLEVECGKIVLATLQWWSQPAIKASACRLAGAVTAKRKRGGRSRRVWSIV